MSNLWRIYDVYTMPNLWFIYDDIVYTMDFDNHLLVNLTSMFTARRDLYLWLIVVEDIYSYIVDLDV